MCPERYVGLIHCTSYSMLRSKRPSNAMLSVPSERAGKRCRPSHSFSGSAIGVWCPSQFTCCRGTQYIISGCSCSGFHEVLLYTMILMSTCFHCIQSQRKQVYYIYIKLKSIIQMSMMTLDIIVSRRQSYRETLHT